MRKVKDAGRDGLAQRQREVISLYLLEGMQPSEIMRELGLCRATVDRAIVRAFHRMGLTS